MYFKVKNNKKKNLIFFGSGTHLKVVIEIATLNNYKIKGIICDNKKKKIYKTPILGNLNYLDKINKKNNYIIIAIGDNKLRKKIFNIIKKKKFKFATLIHPTAIISKNVKIKSGTVITANVTINAGSTIEENCIINTGAIVEHDVIINKNSHIAPGVRIGGQTTIGKDSLIGIGSIIKDKIQIGDNVIIGAGSLVLKHCSFKGIYYGRPAKIKKYYKY